MSILYDEGQEAIASESRRVLEARITRESMLPLLEQVGQYHSDWWAIAREQGWTALAIPEEHGGLGLGLVELGIIAHQAGRSLSGAPFLSGGYGAASAILSHGDAAAKAEWLPKLAGGDAIGAIALAEGPQVLATGVTLSGGTLSGTKPGVVGGGAADVAIVLAQEGGEPVLALAALSGVRRDAVSGFDNSRCLANLHFDGSPASVLARGKAARDAALHLLAEQAVIAAHEATGGAEAMMEIGRDYALTRKAFGQPIGAFQSIKHRIAELWGLIELSRANAIHAAARHGESDFLTAAAAARLSATEAYDTAARDVVQIHGGIGVTWELGLHLHMRRARSLAGEAGNSLFWEDVLVAELAGENA